jgi:uncharacterized protein (DUF2164 family)
MSANIQINTRVRRLIHYIEDIEKGVIQIPAFQRDFIWTNKNKLELFDSLKRGYPIGSVIFWQPTPDKITSETQKIGPYTIPLKTENFFYVLDGFQRLSTLIGCLINPNKTKLGIDDSQILSKEFKIYYDLLNEEFFIPRTTNTEVYQIPVYNLINSSIAFAFEKELRKKIEDEKEVELLMDRLTQVGTTLIDYVLPSIDIIGGEIEEVVEIFSRVNSKGSVISPDWMISALTYDKDKKFRLGTEIDKLVEELKVYNFSNIKRELILQCITNSFGKVYFDQSSKIEQLVRRPEFIDVTYKTVNNIKKAVQFLFEELLIVDSQLLPYGIQLIFVTDFFNQVENPTDNQLRELKKWFWITTYSSYFTLYSLSKQREAYNQFQKFIKDENENPVYNDRPDVPFSVADFPSKIFFGSVRAKALILFLLNHSNDFRSVKVDDIEELDLSYLFYDIKDDKGNFYPESAVPRLNFIENKYKKTKDLSHLLEEESDSLNKLFITKDIQKVYQNKDLVLKLRKNLIEDAETNFYKNLGLT